MSRTRRTPSYTARKIHRYLGLFIGVQFLLWTVGGLYFSWTDLDRVHGDDLHAPQPHLRADAALVSPSAVLDRIRQTEPVDSLASLEMVRGAQGPIYRIAYFTRSAGEVSREIRVADALTGELRSAVAREEAVRIARAAFAYDAPVRAVEYLGTDDVGRHHEYRGQPLPAWAVAFDHASGATAYVAAETGVVQRIRNQRWRVFDFLWMLHTMDYQGRDNFNNLLLRAFSILGLLTVFSGFVLFWLTSRPYLNRRRAPAGVATPSPQGQGGVPPGN